MTTAERLRRDLAALGVRPGGVLMVHASLRALGYVADGPEAVIQGLLAALGPAGTLLMPALTYETVTTKHPAFDVGNTPSNVGLIAETFRTRTGTLRSIHPTHSVCGTGPLAAKILDPHIADTTPCGPHSPFTALPRYRGRILMLGCGLAPNTSMHAIEERVAPPYLDAPPLPYPMTLLDGTTLVKTYAPHDFDGYRQRYDRVDGLLEAPALRRGPVLAAEAILIHAAALWKAVLPVLQSNPLHFVDAA